MTSIFVAFLENRNFTNTRLYILALHSEDFSTYWLSLCLWWGSNPCLCFDHFLTSFQRYWNSIYNLIERKWKSDQSKDRIRTCKLRSKCQSANHYTMEPVVWEGKVLILLIHTWHWPIQHFSWKILIFNKFISRKPRKTSG